MKRKRMAVLMIPISILLVLSFLAWGCAPKPEVAPPAEEEKGPIGTIVIGVISDFTGPTAADCVPQFEGISSIWQAYNDEGGMPYMDPKTGKEERVMFDWDWGDNKGVVGPCPTLYKRMMLRNPLCAYWGSSAVFEALAEWAERDKLLVFGLPTPPASYLPFKRYIFPIGMPYYMYPIVCMDWALEDWRAKGHTDPPSSPGLLWTSHLVGL